jgi:hypothetical protein
VNAADMLLMIVDAGLCRGIEVDVAECRRVLRSGQDAGIFPEYLHCQNERLQREQQRAAFAPRLVLIA